MIPVRFEREAQLEYISAGEWYADRDASAKDRFVEEVERTLRAVCSFPAAFPVVLALRARRPVRRARLRTFPFSLIYVPTPAAIRVLAVAHTSRRPLYWRDRA